jgi:polar amino acid transport system substrate-binding protein
MKLLLLLSFTILRITSSHADIIKLNVVTESFPPFIVVSENEISGIITQKVKRIMAISKLQYTLNTYPWARSYQMATDQPNTLIYSIIKSPERAPYFHWFCPIYKSSAAFAFKLTSNPVNISSIPLLKESLVGTARRGINHTFLKKHGFELGKNLDISATEDINVKKLVNGRIDAIVQSVEAINYRLGKLGYKTVSITKGVAINNGQGLDHCMALSLNSDPIIVSKITHAFQEYQKIRIKD